MARPRKDIDQKQFEKLCALQCTEEEICSVLDVCTDTLEKWIKRTYSGKRFSEVFREKRNVGKVSLRRNQMKLSETNPTMAIWLGKQYLGQKDKQDDEIQAEVNAMLQNIQTMQFIASQGVPNRNIEELE